MILGSEFLEQFHRRIQEASSVDDQVILANFFEDVLANRSYTIGGDAIGAYEALDRSDLSISSFAIASFQVGQAIRQGMPIPTGYRCVYGKTDGSMTRQDWEFMSGTTNACLQSEAETYQLDPASLSLPPSSRAAIMLGACKGKTQIIFVFARQLTNLQGFTLMYRALQSQNRGLGPADIFPTETAH